jgi:hypothetical protein
MVNLLLTLLDFIIFWSVSSNVYIIYFLFYNEKLKGVFKKSKWFLELFISRDTYGMNIHILTIHMTEIVKLAMTHAFTVH